MQVSEIRAVFESLVDDRVANVKFHYWLREATNTIGLVYGRLVTVPIASGDMLPDDFNRVEVLANAGGTRHKDYEIRGDGTIKIYPEGDYTLTYFKVPTPLPANQDDAIPDIPEELHDALPLLCAATFYDMESLGDREESAMGSKFHTKGMQMTQERIKQLRKRYKRIESFT